MKKLQQTIQVVIILILIAYIVFDKVSKREIIFHHEYKNQYKHLYKHEFKYLYKNKYEKEYKPGYQVFTFDLPSGLSFAGERVPLEKHDIRERLDRELHINTYWNSSTVFIIKRAHRWLPQIAKILKKNKVPEDFKYLAVIESGLQNVKSPADALGYWQFLKGTGKEMGLEVNDEVDERYDPLKSTEAACRYLKKAYEKFGSWTNVAASYNMGVGGLQKSLSKQKVKSYYDLHLNEETARYLYRILALKEIMLNPSRYGYNVPEKHLYKQLPLKEITVNETINDLATFALENGTTYKMLKLHNPWLRKNKLTIKKSGKKYTLLLPKNS